MSIIYNILVWGIGGIWAALIITVVFVNPLRARKRVTNGNVVFYIYWNPETKDVYGIDWKREKGVPSETKWITVTKEEYEKLNITNE